MAGMAAVLIAGPTASGKSRLAIRLAKAHRGVVINTDSLQVYRGLQILTARPDPADEAFVPHALYGHVDPSESYSAGRFIGEAATILAQCRMEQRLPIFCGGTGLYFKALLGQLDAMPAVPDEVRNALRRRLAEEGPDVLHRELVQVDAASADRIAAQDGQRIVRALEIFGSTGVPLSRFQKKAGPAIIAADRAVKLVLTPDRTVLRDRIAARFHEMVKAGALEEVARFRAMPGSANSSACKAIGVLELSQVIDGETGLDAALERAVTRTRQYAKRQETWFRHQFGVDWERHGRVDGELPAGLQHRLNALGSIPDA